MLWKIFRWFFFGAFMFFFVSLLIASYMTLWGSGFNWEGKIGVFVCGLIATGVVTGFSFRLFEIEETKKEEKKDT